VVGEGVGDAVGNDVGACDGSKVVISATRRLDTFVPTPNISTMLVHSQVTFKLV
jgi:hypothetical protein